MKRARSAVALLTVVPLLAVGCQGKPAFDNADAFLTAFVQTLARGNADAYENYYLQGEDFDKSGAAATAAIKNFTGRVRNRFLSSCSGAAALLKGREVSIESIEYGGGRPRAALFLRDVGEHFANVTIRLKADDMLISLHIEEVIEVGGQWRLTTFKTVVDTGTERLPDIEIQPSTEKAEEGDPFEEPEQN